MKKLLFLLFVPILLFCAIDTAYVNILEENYNYEVWGNVVALDSLDTLLIDRTIPIGRFNVFSVELIHGDSSQVEMALAALATDFVLKPWDWQALPIIGPADSAWSYGWTDDSLAFNVYARFRIRELAGVNKDTVYFRFKQHTY